MTAAERKEKGLTLARKAHQCQACCQPIVPGELYVRYRCVPWEGDNDGFGTIRVCRFCASQDSCWTEGDCPHLKYVSDEHRTYCREHWAVVVSRELNLWVEFEYWGDEYDPSILDRLAIAKVLPGPSQCSWSRLELRLLPAGDALGWFKEGEYGWREPVRVDDAWGYGAPDSVERGLEICRLVFPNAIFHTAHVEPPAWALVR